MDTKCYRIAKLTISALAIIAVGIACATKQPAAQAPVQPQSQPVENEPTQPIVQNNNASGVLFQDDFQDGQPQEWTITSAWNVEQNGDVYIFAASGLGGAYVPTGGGWNGYTLQSDFRVESGSILLGSNLSKQGRYAVKVSQDGVYLLKEQPSKNWAVLSQSGPAALGNWHKLEFHVLGGRIQVWIDQVLWFDHQDTSPLSQGTIAFSALDGSRVEVDNVKVVKITGSLPTGTVQAPALLSDAPTAQQVIEEVQSSMSGQEVIVEDSGQQGSESTAQADLVFNTTAFDPNPVISGQPFRFNFSIGNKGDGDAGGFAVLIQFDPAAGLNDCTVEYPGLAAKQDNWGGCDLNTNAAAGNYAVQAHVDQNHTVTESNEANNGASMNMSVAASSDGGGGGGGNTGSPDLIIEGLTFSPAKPKQGQTFNVSFKIRNYGNASAGAFTIRLKFHAVAAIADCNVDVDGLASGQPFEANCNRVINGAAGNYPVKLTADVEGEITESNENNNVFEKTLTVEAAQGGGGGLPDLVVQTVRIPSSATISCVIANNGTADAPSGAMVAFYYNDGFIEMKSINAVPQAASVTVDFIYNYAAPFTAACVVDYNRTVEESNESNNTLERAY